MNKETTTDDSYVYYHHPPRRPQPRDLPSAQSGHVSPLTGAAERERRSEFQSWVIGLPHSSSLLYLSYCSIYHIALSILLFYLSYCYIYHIALSIILLYISYCSIYHIALSYCSIYPIALSILLLYLSYCSIYPLVAQPCNRGIGWTEEDHWLQNYRCPSILILRKFCFNALFYSIYFLYKICKKWRIVPTYITEFVTAIYICLRNYHSKVISQSWFDCTETMLDW